MPTKILAIDDSKTMRLAIKISFAAEDAEVTAVSKGSEAVVRAKQMGADIVLVDAVLAGGEPSGYDVCQQLKADGATAKVPVLVLVSNQTGPDVAKLKSCGADGWVAKPFETQELIDKVSEVLAKAGKPMTTQPPVPATHAAATASAAAPQPVATITPPAAATKPVVTIPAAAQAAPAASTKTTPRAPQPLGTPVAEPVRTVVATAPERSTSTATPLRITPPPGGDGEAGIPIAIPIPFTSADAPTPGILERLRRAQGATAGLDPRVAEALVALSREVLEAAVWEVVPELAEQILREEARKRASA
jgi:CheY-like chemotaxis protein